MSSKRYQGTLKTWKGDRGFGFIRPHGGGKDVFLHITAVRAAPRPPQVGDQLSYEIALQADGKVRAVNAAIAGVSQSPGTVRSPQPQATPTAAQNASTLVVVAVSAVGAVGLLLGLGGLLHDRWQRDLAARSAPADVPSVTTSPTPAAASRPPSPSPASPAAVATPPVTAAGTAGGGD
ncbi:MAG TPA: cold shock domain-containing protein [Candidatus Obscuribacterales bacterium]